MAECRRASRTVPTKVDDIWFDVVRQQRLKSAARGLLEVGLGVANSVIGRTYQLQRSNTLAGWIDVGIALPGNGGLLSFDETVDPEVVPRRFYRVVIGP